MNGGLSDFETIIKYKIDCTIVILNNASLGFVKYGQALLYEWHYYDVDRPDSDFAKIANSFGARGVSIKTIQELERELQYSTKNHGFHVLDVKTDPKELLPINYY
jgi:thiamine pyrophosphate-dependent acetolactate synthase large subunit-like protein